MIRIAQWAALVALLAAVWLIGPPLGAGSPYIGTDEIAPGMKGYGLTVFSGTEPERFGVEVVSVVPNFLLRQNIILIRCDHPVTDKAGVIGGMSGSPIFIDGRLAGALAYGWSFAKEPLAGVTPIANMLEVMKRPIREPGEGGARGRILTSRLLGDTAQAPARTQLESPESGLSFARTPLSLAGFHGAAERMLSEGLASFGMDPVQGGGSGSKPEGPATFANGGAIGVQLIRGDMSATAIGTVTAIEGKNVLAFGHPMFEMGQEFLPVSTARIHTVQYSVARSNKIGSPLREAGSLVQDRQSCIVARTDRRADAIPVGLTLVDERAKRRDTYKVEIASHRFLTPRLLQAAILEIISEGAADTEDVVAEIEGRMKVSGRPPVVLRDSGASRGGLSSLASWFRPVSVVADVLDNPFEDAKVESLDFEVRLRYGLDVATIVGVSVAAERPEPGDVVNVVVRLRPYDGDEQLVTVPVRIPDTAGGQEVQIEVGGGDFMIPVLPAPQSLDDMLGNVRRFYPPASLVVALNVPGEGVTLRGRAIERLPASAVDSLLPALGKEQAASEHGALRQVVPTSIIVRGMETIRFTVSNRRTR
ncbi:MAG: SpoIVB peptidase S55 domain-containing protein [Deltaproteobacteria bacterium]|nr:SpoIVB peptidase S55 domain-containing protein [Deltaproteobacteria bacterium]